MRFLLFIFILVCNSLVVLSKQTHTTAIIHSTIVNVISGKLDNDQTVLIDSNRVNNIGNYILLPTARLKC